MKLQGTREFDNRDSERVYQYMEARIEALQRRILELEAEREQCDGGSNTINEIVICRSA